MTDVSDATTLPTAQPQKKDRSGAVRALLVIAALAGVFICGVLLKLTVAGSDRAQTDAWCRPTAKVDCSHVLASRYAKFGFLPTAQIGQIYFACAAVWFAIVGIPNRWGRAWQLLPILVTGAGLLGSAFFLFIMSRLPVWCTWCAAAHGANLLMFALSVAGWFAATGEGDARPSLSRVGVGAGFTLSIGAITLLAGAAYRQQSAAGQCQRRYTEIVNDVDYVVWRHSVAPHTDIPVREDDMILGAANAPHTLVIFTDFECAGCALLHQNIAALSANFPGALRIVFRHYPMCRACNAHVDRDLHFFSCDAALAADAARATGDRDAASTYWNLLFASQDRLDQAPYADIARRAKIDVAAFEKAMKSDAALARVKADIELGRQLGVDGTPAIFLDGRRLSQWGLYKTDSPGKPDARATLRLWSTLLGAAADTSSQRPQEPR